MIIQTTKEYEKFKFCANRKIVPILVRRISEELILNPNCLSTSPVVISPDFTVIDGQHRIKACEYLKFPVYYIVDYSLDTIEKINNSIKTRNVNQRQWKLDDYSTFYAMQGKEEYQFIENLIKKHSPMISITSIFYLLRTNEGTIETKNIKSGNLQITNKEEVAQFLNNFCDMFYKLKIPSKHKRILSCKYYMLGLYKLWKEPKPRVSFNIFCEKIPFNWSKLSACATQDQVLESIYYVCRCKTITN